MLLVDLETGVYKTPCQNSSFGEGCLYVVCAQNHKGLKARSGNRWLLGVAQTEDFDKLSMIESGENLTQNEQF